MLGLWILISHIWIGKALPQKYYQKKGDLSDPNNWRGIVLMEVSSKIISIFLNIKLQKLLKIRGSPLQFGASPKLGCQNAVFILKTALQERREKGLDTFATFIDLVKAYDSDSVALAALMMASLKSSKEQEVSRSFER